TIPVVFLTFADPVRTGLVASFAHPGRNLTGVTMIAAELAGKRLVSCLRNRFTIPMTPTIVADHVETCRRTACQSRGSRVVGDIGRERQDAPASRVAGAHRVGRRRGAAESCAGQGTEDQSADAAPVAAALRRGRRGRTAEGCGAAGAQEADSA